MEMIRVSVAEIRGHLQSENYELSQKKTYAVSRGVLPSMSHKGMSVPPQRVGFLRCFGLKTGIEFAHFGLESGMVFEGITGVFERICLINSKRIGKKDRIKCKFEMDFKKSFY